MVSKNLPYPEIYNNPISLFNKAIISPQVGISSKTFVQTVFSLVTGLLPIKQHSSAKSKRKRPSRKLINQCFFPVGLAYFYSWKQYIKHTICNIYIFLTPNNLLFYGVKSLSTDLFFNVSFTSLCLSTMWLIPKHCKI